MAIAEYYERAALAASQVIAGFDPLLFQNTLERTTVGFAIDRSCASSTEGKVLAELTIRLLARVYSSLELRIGLSEEEERLTDLAREINPRIEIRSGASAGIAVGIQAATFDNTYYAGSNGWDACLSSRESLQTGSSPNPFGASAAACLAAANLFNRIFMPDGEKRIGDDVVFSTFERERKRTPGEIPNNGWALSGEAVLVGVGAVGNGAVWALGRSPLAATLHIVDPETVELSNLQRYVLGLRKDEGTPKVELAKSYFHSAVKPVMHKESWAEFLSESGYHWQHVLVALDTAAGRRSVQASLPNWIANSWTQPGDLGISIHGRFNGPGACLGCLYLPSGQLPNEDAIVAEALGVPELVTDVRTLLHTGKGVARQFIEAVAIGLRRPLTDVLLYEGRPVRDLYVEGVCGGGLITLGSAGTPRQELHVPLAHQSALAGVLLASVLVRHSFSGDDEQTMITRINILDPLGTYLTQPALKAGTRMCICEDTDYVTAFEAKYRNLPI